MTTRGSALGAATWVLVALHPAPLPAQEPVRAWEDTITIPTYPVGPAERDPIFYHGEAYQGAQRHVYPYALQDALTDGAVPRTYKALILENRYLRITVLPELGGRVFSAVDRTNGYDFIYRQHVIKPALIGMLGAWISGGIEWDVFHHHRATSFMPVDYALASGPDGSRTIWVGETERRQRMRWLVAMTLRPDRAVLDVTVRLLNRTPMSETMLYWANVAVHADSQYRVVFPPSVRVATYHGKTVFTTWPVGSGAYAGGVDYAGVDLRWWKNHPSPTSFFAWDPQEDFSGGYDHGRDAGIVHVGDHHVLEGAKLWEWGPGEAGRLWDSRILTDSDGPYAELMVGAYSDNQPDYTWLEPYAVREFAQHWYPVHGIGGFVIANVDGAANLEIGGDAATVAFYATSERRGARAMLRVRDEAVLDTTIAIDPAHPFRRRVALPAGTSASDIDALLLDARGDTVVRYRPPAASPPSPLPTPVRPPPEPADVRTADELIAIGERAEQMNSPRVDPDAYYAEALRRDSLDARASLRVGERFNRRWLFDSAEVHLRRALMRLGLGYTTPENTEILYQLGIALRGQGRDRDARDAFARAAWDPGHAAAAYHQLAELSLRGRDYARASGEIRQALALDPRSDKARAFEATALRHLGRLPQAQWVAEAAAEDDPFAFLARNELVLALRARRDTAAARAVLADLGTRMRGEVENYLELAADYEAAGQWDEAADVLQRARDLPGPSGRPYPMVEYHLAYAYERMGDTARSRSSDRRAAALPADYCFPFRFESYATLMAALQEDAADARTRYYLGSLLYDRQPRAAIGWWESAGGIDSASALVRRNLGWASRWTERELAKATEYYRAARAMDPRDGRVAIELDEVLELANAAPEARLAALQRSAEALRGRSDGVAREVLLLTALGRYDRALLLLAQTHFHVQELAGAIHDAYVDAHLLRGSQRLEAGNDSGALTDFVAAGAYPENLEVGRPLRDPRAPQVAWFTSLALAAAGDGGGARAVLEEAASQPGTEGWPETRYYQGLALRRLGRRSGAVAVFAAVVEAGRAAVARATAPDVVARPGAAAAEASARRVLGLGLLGQGDTTAARRELTRAVELRLADPWARYYLTTLHEGP
jgi:tetratricopeptide (TPR) repeat protein